MKYKQIILDTRKMLGFRLTDVKHSLGVTTGVKLSVKLGGKIGNKAGSKNRKPDAMVSLKANII